MQVNVDTGSVLRGRSVEVIFALVRKKGKHHILDSIHFWLGGSARAMVSFITGVIARSTPSCPFVIKIPVQICASIGTGRTTIIFIGVLAPQIPCFCLFTAVRVSQEHDINLVVIQQPMHVGIGVVVLDEIAGEAGG